MSISDVTAIVGLIYTSGEKCIKEGAKAEYAKDGCEADEDRVNDTWIEYQPSLEVIVAIIGNLEENEHQAQLSKLRVVHASLAAVKTCLNRLRTKREQLTISYHNLRKRVV